MKPRSRNLLSVLTFSLLATSIARAEVMDKELSIAQIWDAALFGIALCVVGAAIWRWLIPALYIVGLFTGLSFAWTEWFDPQVGPSIAHEAGKDYGMNVLGAIFLLQICHIAAWFISGRVSFINLLSRRGKHPSLSAPAQNLVFASLLLFITAAGALSGFGSSLSIWLFLPLLIPLTFLLISVWRYSALAVRTS